MVIAHCLASSAPTFLHLKSSMNFLWISNLTKPIGNFKLQRSNRYSLEITKVLYSFDGEASPPASGGQGGSAFIIWSLPDWQVVHA